MISEIPLAVLLVILPVIHSQIHLIASGIPLGSHSLVLFWYNSLNSCKDSSQTSSWEFYQSLSKDSSQISAIYLLYITVFLPGIHRGFLRRTFSKFSDSFSEFFRNFSRISHTSSGDFIRGFSGKSSRDSRDSSRSTSKDSPRDFSRY